MSFDLQTIDWTAIGTLATTLMVVATFIALCINHTQLKTLKHQNKDIQKQSFENTLTFLIKEFRNSRDRVVYNLAESTGHQAFIDGWEDFRMRIEVEFYYDGEIHPNNKRERFRKSEDKESFNLIMMNYYLLVLNNMPDFNGYYNALSAVVRLIDNSKYSQDEKKYYFAIVTNTLSEVELKWLYYTCAINESYKELRAIVEKWGLLEMLTKDKLIHISHALWLSKTAFGNQRYKIIEMSKQQ